MNNKIKKLAVALTFAATASVAFAQNSRSGYFVEEYTYRFEQNPAIANEKNFIAIPALGNMNIRTNGNVGVKDIFYIVDGKTSLFMNPGVSASEVMNNLNDNNRIDTDIKMTILSTGFKGFGGYNTLSLNVRATANTSVPKSLFSLLKEGVTNETYDITDLRARANAYVELALSHSHAINKQLRVGAAMKFLVGGANAEAKLDEARLVLGENSWSAVTRGTLNSSVKGLTYKTDVNEDTGHEYVSGIDVDNTGVNGFGLAFDLGAVYSPAALPDWQFSASLLDLGFIHWNNNVVASTNGTKSFESDKYTFNVDKDAPNAFKNEWKALKNDVSALYELDDMGDIGSRTTTLGATLNIGASYTLPVYRKLKFGLLNTTRIDGAYSNTEFRLSANVAPVKVFSCSANAAIGTYGGSFGWLANLHVTGFNLFLGMDHLMCKTTKDGIPMSTNAQVNFGMNILF